MAREKSKRTENDKAWEHYIVERGLKFDGRTISVDAKDLKKITGREPRLLAKFDTPNAQPSALQAAGYSLLPTENGVYLLFQGDIFQTVEPCTNVGAATYTLPFPLVTADRGLGEMQYLDHAFNTGIIADFIGSQPLYLTIRGRERTPAFQFTVNGFPIKVDGVQIEVDGGFEGKQDIILVEAKVGDPHWFNIRQLYYPYRRFLSLAPRKRIRSVFLKFDSLKQRYSFYEYRFADPTEFRSLQLLRCQTYLLPKVPTLRVSALQDAQYTHTSSVVPQADDLTKVLQTVQLVNEGTVSAKDIALHFDFSERQGDYYKEAAEYLGLITRLPGTANVAPHGLELLDAPIPEQLTVLAKLIINSWVFQRLIQIAGTQGAFTESDIRSLIEHAEPHPGRHYTGDTIERRTETVLAWSRWLASQIGCFEQDPPDSNRFRLR